MVEYYIYQNEEDKAVRTETDLKLMDDAVEEKRPWLGWVFVKIHSPDERGWCAGEECDRLSHIQNALTEVLREKFDALGSGVRMHEGWQEFFFYLPTAKKFDNIAASVMKSYASYGFETGSTRDVRWQHYKNQLYPNPLMLQQIQSRTVIRELEDAGDDISQARAVEHYLFFQTEAQRERVIHQLEEAGFTLKKTIYQDTEFGYGAVVVKEHNVNESTMMEVTGELLNVVHHEHGVYEGWSTVLAP